MKAGARAPTRREKRPIINRNPARATRPLRGATSLDGRRAPPPRRCRRKPSRPKFPDFPSPSTSDFRSPSSAPGAFPQKARRAAPDSCAEPRRDESPRGPPKGSGPAGHGTQRAEVKCAVFEIEQRAFPVLEADLGGGLDAARGREQCCALSAEFGLRLLDQPPRALTPVVALRLAAQQRVNALGIACARGLGVACGRELRVRQTRLRAADSQAREQAQRRRGRRGASVGAGKADRMA